MGVRRQRIHPGRQGQPTAMNRFVEHQMLSIFKELWATVTGTSKNTATLRRHVSTHYTYWWDVMRIDTTSVIIICVVHSSEQLNALTNKAASMIAAGRSHSYNDNTSSLSKEGSQSIVWSCSNKHTFETGHSYRRPQRMCMNEICETVLDRRPGYSKGLGWGPKPNARKTASAGSVMTSCSQSTIELQLRSELNKAKRVIEEQIRK
ncbi:NBS-LRR type resistance protein [Cucumis melo var. makuwa]|uniref:NBS-LRR type resistance protein n=1 Tax=Cucumis melo var. makuwa TaxID=1194695 RepID=A0A5D3DRU8_CUCMM|nr:NBS-LRR type resistance protein [Cucumis melo var. makuwa]TYK26000.1 NBS-LRR type resistance protein [Cucumis melo var. makuwa]